MPTDQRLHVFLCHASQDKPIVRALYDALKAEGWIGPWLDKAKIQPGQDWRMVIEQAVEESDMVIVCLSKHAVTKEGFVQKEIRYAYDIALEKPEGIIFLVPLRLEECEVPRGLRSLQWVDYFGKDKKNNYQDLLEAMRHRAGSLGIAVKKAETRGVLLSDASKEKNGLTSKLYSGERASWVKSLYELKLPDRSESLTNDIPKQTEITWGDKVTIGGIELMRVPKGKFIMGSNDYDDEKPQHTLDIPYDYWMGRFPATNAQYIQFTTKNFLKGKEDHPVVDVSWSGAKKYVKWLDDEYKLQLPKGLLFRLPSEAEWEKAARGTDGRVYPWGNTFDKNKCNTSEGGKKDTMPVGLYSPQGDSPFGCADMVGNVWEWTRSLYKPYPYQANDGREDEKDTSSPRGLRGGSWRYLEDLARLASRGNLHPYVRWGSDGFRVALASPPM
jgi:formylglycine-generating enzyme required for sulfatase activity